MAGKPQAGSQSLGLAEQRRRRGISLEAVAARTKISINLLRAIEAEEFEKLPGGVYNSSYIRQYAESTSAGEADIFARYAAFLEAVSPATLPPELGTSRLRHAVRRVLKVFRRQPPVAAGGRNEQPV